MDGQAWELARAAARRSGVDLRELTTLDDADAVISVMIATWGEHQLLPRELIRALQGAGNLPLGAFEGDRLIGYVLGFIGYDPEDGLHVHSHMLAVVPERRHAGAGAALKLAQRAQALEAGISVMRWTFDPLQARNAYFNFAKLGVVADRFHREYYGEMGDVLNRGDRSDRLEARWDLRASPPLLHGGGHDPGGQVEGAPSARVLLRRVGPGESPTPELLGTSVAPGGPVSVEVPPEYADLRGKDPALASRWRDATADAFDACFRAGLVAVEFRRSGAYILSPPTATDTRGRG